MIKRAVLDSSIFIGRFYSKDKGHNNSRKILLEDFISGKIKEIYITDYVIIETINFLLNKMNYEEANKFLNYVTTTEGIRIIYMTDLDFYKLKKLFQKYKSLSFTDCSLIAAAEEINTNIIYSFDSGFDKIKGIKRLTS